jgi:glucose/mannose transport system permease protein
MKTEFTASRLAIYTFLVLSLAFFCLPAWFALVNSFKPLDEIYAGNVFGLPKHWTTEAWSKTWNKACTGAPECRGLSQYFINSLLAVVPATLIGTLWGCLNGYVLAKWRFKGSEAVLFVLMFGSFIPIGLFLFP